MKARALEKIIKSGRIVCESEENICVGTSMCSRLITVNKKTLKLRYAFDTFNKGRKSIDSKDLLFVWDKLTELIDSGEIHDFISGYDEIEDKLPVFYIEDNKLIESYTDKYGWPNVTYDGVLMYNNTHFKDKNSALRYGIKDCAYTIKLLSEREVDLTKKLLEKRNLIGKYHEGLSSFKLLQKESDPESYQADYASSILKLCASAPLRDIKPGYIHSKIIEIWMAGRFTTYGEPWEVLGVYESKEAAIKRCTQERDFITSFDLGKDLPEERQDMPICIYPFFEEKDGE